MLTFNVCVGGGRGQGAIFKLLFLILFFRIQSLTPNHFLAKQTEFGRIFHRQHLHLKRIFSYSILKVNLCTSRRTQLQQKLDMSLFCYFELILFVCIDVLRRCQHFCSHDATFPVHPG